MATKNIIGPELDENQQHQPPATPTRCVLTRIFETVSSIALTPFNILCRQLQPQEAICELEIELNINNSPSDISNPSDSNLSLSNGGNQNNPSLSSSNRGNCYRNNEESFGIEEVDIDLIQGQEEENNVAEEDNSDVVEGDDSDINKSNALEEEEEEKSESDIDNNSRSSKIPFGEEEDHNTEEVASRDDMSSSSPTIEPMVEEGLP